MTVDKQILIPTIRAKPEKSGGAKLQGLTAKAYGSQLPYVITQDVQSVRILHVLKGISSLANETQAVFCVFICRRGRKKPITERR
jgi:hypothetical protein